MEPTAPETGYGYIQRGTPIAGVEGAFKVQRFVEKPDLDTAMGYVADGGYYWNGGMFVFRADVLFEEIDRHAPTVLPAVREALAKAKRDLDFIRLDADSFAKAPNISIDYAIMENTERAALVPCSIGWSDVGSWSSLWEIREQDGSGNVLVGDVIAHDTQGSFVRSEKRSDSAGRRTRSRCGRHKRCRSRCGQITRPGRQSDRRPAESRRTARIGRTYDDFSSLGQL